jgi:hypothetical protein
MRPPLRDTVPQPKREGIWLAEKGRGSDDLMIPHGEDTDLVSCGFQAATIG